MRTIPDERIEQELAIAERSGAVDSWHGFVRHGGRRRWALTLADGTVLDLGAGAVLAFCAGVRVMLDDETIG